MGPYLSQILQRWGSVIVCALLIMLKPLHCIVIMSALSSVLTSYIAEEHEGRFASRAPCTVCRGCA